MNRDFERIGRSFQIRFSILGCAEEVWYGWRDSDRGIIYRRWHAAARDFGANSGFGLGFFLCLGGVEAHCGRNQADDGGRSTFLAITRLARANSVWSCAVFLCRPR